MSEAVDLSKQGTHALQHDGTHYKGMAIQPIVFAKENHLDPYQFSAIKHICRHPVKGEGVMDLKKAIHYLQMALEYDYGVSSIVTYPDPVIK